MIVEGNKLIPSDGYKYITNGEVFSECVFLGIHDSPENWHDTNDTPDQDPDIDDEEMLAILMGGAV